MPEQTLEEFLDSKRKDGSQKKYEENLESYHIANRYVMQAIEDYLGDLATHSKEKYIEIFDALDFELRRFAKTKPFESVYTRIYEGKYKEAQIFTEVPDIGRARIVCRTLGQKAFLKDHLVNGYLLGRNKMRLIETKDFWHNPTEAGYRAVNYIFIIPKEVLGVPRDICYELQLMTEMEDTWTELSHVLVYKNRKFSKEEMSLVKKQMARIGDIIAALNEMYEDMLQYARSKANER